MTVPKSSSIVFGVGSPHADDRIGWEICDAITSLNDFHHSVVEVAKLKSPIEMMNWLPEYRSSDAPTRMIICDGCEGLGAAGQVGWWRWPSNEFAKLSGSGTHDFSVPQVLDLATSLNRLPPMVELWAVEKSGSDDLVGGKPLPANIVAALHQVATKVFQSILAASPLEGNDCFSG